MKKLVFAFLTLTASLTLPSYGAPQIAPKNRPAADSDESIVYFTPPPQWQLGDATVLPPSIRMMVVGKGSSGLPPSISLGWEPYEGTLQQYLKNVKNLNIARGDEWKDLGKINTDAGTGNLSQVDTKSPWGQIRSMYVIILKNKTIYILNASALKDEFSTFYKDFFTAMRSLKIAKDIYEMVPNPQQRAQLKAEVSKLQKQWTERLAAAQKENQEMSIVDLQEKIFNSNDFQNNGWTPFKEIVKNKYNQAIPEWYSLFLQKIEDQLFNMTIMMKHPKEEPYVNV